MKKFVSYVRVSTAKQGASGLGLDAQRAAVAAYVVGRGTLVEEFVEVETGKGSNALERRPELRAALAACKRQGAVLLIAKLDRLARNVHFVSGLLESGIDFVAADMPEANKTMIQIHSVMAEWERDQISARTKAALAASRARGIKLGVAGPENLKPNLAERQRQADAHAARLQLLVSRWIASGLSQRAMMDELNTIGVPAPRGGAWRLIQVQRLLKRVASLSKLGACALNSEI
jgi:DNA invertase Pin-like site-specific DNA recombinase